MTGQATPNAEPQPEAEDLLFGEALNRVRMDWPDARNYEDAMWRLSDWFNDRDAPTVKTYEMWLLSLYLLAKLLYGPERHRADVDAVIRKPQQTVQ